MPLSSTTPVASLFSQHSSHHDHPLQLQTHKHNTTKAYLSAYLRTDGADIAWDFIRAACQSVARTAIVPLQDVLRLDNAARMNTPGRAAGNWAWRVSAGSGGGGGSGSGSGGGGGDGVGAAWRALSAEARELRELAHATARLPRGARLDHA